MHVNVDDRHGDVSIPIWRKVREKIIAPSIIRKPYYRHEELNVEIARPEQSVGKGLPSGRPFLLEPINQESLQPRAVV